jgi:hypothetical protein
VGLDRVLLILRRNSGGCGQIMSTAGFEEYMGWQVRQASMDMGRSSRALGKGRRDGLHGLKLVVWAPDRRFRDNACTRARRSQ